MPATEGATAAAAAAEPLVSWRVVLLLLRSRLLLLLLLLLLSRLAGVPVPLEPVTVVVAAALDVGACKAAIVAAVASEAGVDRESVAPIFDSPPAVDAAAVAAAAHAAVIDAFDGRPRFRFTVESRAAADTEEDFEVEDQFTATTEPAVPAAATAAEVGLEIKVG